MTTSILAQNVYLAGPIQHAADYGKGWRARLKSGDMAENADAFEFVDPMDKYNTQEQEYDEWTDESIVEDDLEMIRECKALLAHWLEVPTCGTPMEIFYSSRVLDIPVVVQTSVPAEELSPWLTAHADAVVRTFDDAVNYLIGELYGESFVVGEPEIVDVEMGGTTDDAIGSFDDHNT